MTQDKIESIIQDGYELKIKPAQLKNRWLGINPIGYEVSVSLDGHEVCSSTHRLLEEAISDVYFDMPTRELSD